MLKLVFANLKSVLVIFAFVSLLVGCGKQIKNSDALLRKSVDLALTNGKWEKALNYAKRALALDPNNIEAQVMAAVCMDKTGSSEEAAKLLRNLILSNPKNFLAEFSLGGILYGSKKYEEAYEHLACAYNMNNDNIEALALYAECAGNILEKTTPELYARLLNANSSFSKLEIYNNLGVYFANSQNHNIAFANFMKAYRTSPSNPIIIANLGIFKDRFQSDSRQARFFYRKFIAITRDNPAFDKQRKIFSDRLKDF